MENLAKLIEYFLIDSTLHSTQELIVPNPTRRWIFHFSTHVQASLSLATVAIGAAVLSPGVSRASQPEQDYGDKGHLQSAAHD